MHRDTVGRPMEILLVEDSLTAATLTIKTLRKSGFKHRLTWLSDGVDACNFAFQERQFDRAPQPDLILLDLNLPGMHGKELLERIRSDDRLRNVPVVIMTGEQSEIDEAFAELDVQAWMPKPINTARFLKLVDQLKDYWKADMILPTA